MAEVPTPGKLNSTEIAFQWLGEDISRFSDGNRAEGQVSEGDRVLFSTYSGTEVSVDDENLLIMREDDILAILN